MFNGRKKINLAFLAFLACAFLLLFHFQVQALGLSRVSDTIRSSAPAIYTDHAIQFRVNTAIPAGGKIVITPQPGAFYLPNLFDAFDVDLATATSAAGQYSEIDISSTTASSSKIIDYNVANFTTGAGPRAGAAADFNNDGYDDVAVANYNGASLSVFLNDQSNGFNKTDKTTGANPVSVAAGDFNNDGFADIVAANASSGTVSVFLNNGDGTFANKADYPTGANPSSVAVSDFDRDGDVDLAVANYDDGSISIIKNTGTGTFNPKVDYTAGAAPTALKAADLNNDDYPDLVYASLSGNTVSALLSGNGIFGIKQSCDTGASPQSVAVGDFNKDGYLDFATANYASSSVSVFQNNRFGSPLCSSRTDYASGADPKDIIAADLNMDRFADLAVVSASGDTTSIFLNNFNGAFLAKTDNPTVQNPSSINFGDFNNDDKNDLAITGYDNNELSVWTFEKKEFFYKTDPSAGLAGVEIVSDSFSGHVEFTLNSAVGIDAGTYVRIKLGKNAVHDGAGMRQIMNPIDNGSYRININTFDAGDNLLDRSEAMIAVIGQVFMSAGTPGRYNETPRRGSVLVEGATETIISIQTMQDAECHLAMTDIEPSPFSTTTIKDYGYAFDAEAASGTSAVIMTDSFDNATGTTKFHSTTWSGLTDGKYFYAYVRCKYADNNFVDIDDFQIYFSVEGGTSTGTSTTGGGTGTGAGGGTGGGSGGGTGGGTGGGSGGGSGTGAGGGSGGGSGGGYGGGSGGGAGSLLRYPPDLTTPVVDLLGWAYPLSPVFVLRDGKITKEIKADANAQFMTTITDLAQGVYTFGLSAKDDVNRVSPLKNTTFWIKKGTKTTVSDIFIPPTVDLNKSILSKSDILEVFGQSVPQSTIEVWLSPVKDNLLEADILKTTGVAAGSGKWKVTINPSSLASGEYRIKARSNIARVGYSDFSNILSCGIDSAAGGNVCDRADLNKDSKRNIIDFSIMMYHWNTNHATGDINQDGKVNLIDFSMLMFCWTG